VRILIVAACPMPWPRGTPIRIHRMAEALVERGHDVHVATYPVGDDSVDISYQLHRVEATDADMDTSPGPSLRKLLWLDPLLWRVVRRLLATESFDVVHAHHYEGLITALFARQFSTSIPVVYDAHTLLATELPHYRMRLPTRSIARIGEVLDRNLPPRADHVIAVTERMRDWFLESTAIPASQLSMIPNGVEYEHFRSSGPNGNGWKPGRARGPRIVFAGNLAEYQGIEALLEAFTRLRARAADARLVFVTDSELGHWQQRIEALGLDGAVDIVRSGFDELPAQLGQADVLVNPRMDCDGIPQKLLNYMASGRPIVSFAGSAPVLRDEETGLVVQDGDIAGFAEGIQRLLQNPKLGLALGTAARQEAGTIYSWQSVAEQVESVYDRAIARAAH
jgi:glycosyltransferase involved in cell wall biosynthesis